MFDEWERGNDWDRQVDEIEARIVAKEAEICRLRSEQAQDLARLDRLQVDLADGDRGMVDWVSSHLDVSHQTAMRLMQIARADDPAIHEAMRQGRWGLDRASLLVRLQATGASTELMAQAAESYSLGRLYGLVLQRRQLTSLDEQAGFESGYLVIQPSLDEQMFKLWGLLPALHGHIVEKALSQKETSLPVLPGETNGQRRVDALTAICLDSLTGGSEDSPGRAVTVAEVFVDGHLTANGGGEAGGSTSSGLRVGPNTLSEILCDGKIRVVSTDGHRPVAVS